MASNERADLVAAYVGTCQFYKFAGRGYGKSKASEHPTACHDAKTLAVDARNECQKALDLLDSFDKSEA
jgi:hypothetical protein